MAPQPDALHLRGAVRLFSSQRSPRLITLYLVAVVVGRLVLGGWSWWDVLGPGVLLGAQPFTEWAIHVHLLHFRPRAVAGRRIDPLVSRKHRAHHADPKDLGLVFIPLPALVALEAALAAVCLLVLPLGPGLTTLVAAATILFVYEWTHFLIHSTYRPRHALYRYVWRAHRNHHFRNEHYWFGVTMHLADHVLGTFPEKASVAVSPTARTLGIEDAA
ncbi:MAG TPA: sterol desaturase family protein [Acidimicrobiales bacterium]|nr:sterol desaturase family protein [Acidimicrobiales bacterium]